MIRPSTELVYERLARIFIQPNRALDVTYTIRKWQFNFSYFKGHLEKCVKTRLYDIKMSMMYTNILMQQCDT